MTAKTGVPPSAITAAAWSCVENTLHDAQRTSAPSAFSVSISTAVWMVMCRLPVIRAPAERLLLTILGAQGHQPRHLGFRDIQFLAAIAREGDILDDVILCHRGVAPCHANLQRR